MVEFVSEGRRNWKRDYVTKRDEYLSAGVSEYWVIDRFQRSLTVFRLLHQTVSEQIVRGSETYRPDLLPGFELSLSRLLSLADWWEEK